MGNSEVNDKSLLEWEEMKIHKRQYFGKTYGKCRTNLAIAVYKKLIFPPKHI